MVHLEPVGTGESGRPADSADCNLRTYPRFLHAVVEHLDVLEVALLDHPDRVSGAVLYGTSPVTGAEFWGGAVANVTRFAEFHAAAAVVAAVGAASAPGRRE
jgi:proline iminopeptidase